MVILLLLMKVQKIVKLYDTKCVHKNENSLH